MKTPHVAVLLCVLLLGFVPVASEATLIVRQEYVPMTFRGAELQGSGGAFFSCLPDGTCITPAPATREYYFLFGWDSSTHLPATAGIGPLLFDINGTVGPTVVRQTIAPYDLGTNLAGTLTATLTTEPLPGIHDEIFFAIAHSTGLVRANISPGAFAFDASDATHYFAVVYGALSGPVSYRLTVTSASVPEPGTPLLLLVGLATLAALAKATRARRLT